MSNEEVQHTHPANHEPLPTEVENTPPAESVNVETAASGTVDDSEPALAEVAYEQTAPAVEEGVAKGNLQYQPQLTFYNYGMEVLTKYTLNADIDTEVVSNYTPELIHTDKLTEADTYWSQHIRREGGAVIGPRRPRLASTGGTLTGMAAIESIRRVAGAGGSLTYELAHSGLVITVTPVKETEMIDFEFDLTRAATQVGLSTTGLLLNGRSGVFSEALVNLALDHITSCNFKEVGTNFRALADYIDPLDYGALIWGMLATTLANGHPWEFACTNGECKHRREALVNFSRMLWVNRNGLTEKQQNMLVKFSNNITAAQLTEYRQEFTDKAATYTMSTGVIVHWQRSTLAEYLRQAKEWVSAIEKQYNTAMTNYFTEAERRRYLNGQIQARRMHKYIHQVGKIMVPSAVEGEYDEIVDRDAIHAVLLELTAITPDIREFETAAVDYIESNTVQVVGYPGVKCTKCNHVPKGRGGEFRSIVPVAVDRVFFTYVQRKTLALMDLATV
jgi:hypothetical protein